MALIDLPLSPSGGNVWFGAISRPLSLVVIWTTAILVYRHGQMARQLREQEALARVGAMAAVLAHEVRNPLTGLRNGLEILARRMPADSRDRESVRTMQARIDSLNEMMHDVLLFAREPPIRCKSVPIESLMQGLAASMRTEFPDVEVILDVSATRSEMPGDAEQLQLALGNVLRNAAQARDGHGRVSVTTRADDRVCMIRVRDEGPGLPLAVRGRLFEPFVTTKSRGTGLGLAITRRIVKAHQGTIEVSCPRDGGTLVMVTLPARTPRTS
ncbi:MAG: two-component system sensor histidine kinase NtrB [Burkholderiales bacterium]